MLDYRGPVKILMADDDNIDKELFTEALNICKIPFELKVVTNGQELLEHLENVKGEYPDFILMDLNMPRLNGLQTLQTIRKSDVYRTIPVFILSTSKAQYDVTECYKAGANLYMVKPVEFDPLVDMFKNLLNLFHKGNVVTTEIIDLSTDFMY